MRVLWGSLAVACACALGGCKSSEAPAENTEAAAEEKAGCKCGPSCKCDACTSGDHATCTCGS